ncbi:hypothetical protein BDZ90DRAFT_229314 [Jaminaea rosea]|uniref:Uncharacterized protein n=1 Tax=Jaminaea rosea TaxID=1569628 RepID=A0A316UZW2_9BASI|nr:hypothetical protein BDZ90DRAFT_229314 [Jaminaea rosea]PWN30298.1 hypothetical protein BDZ90DRAFT_229314 [Jaminaea rosea]
MPAPSPRAVKQSPLFLGAALATVLFSIVIIIILFVPFGEQTIHYNYVRSTSSSLPNGQYLTAGRVYATSEYLQTVTFGSLVHTYTSTDVYPTVVTYTAAPGFEDGIPYETVTAYSGTTYDISGTATLTFPFTSSYTVTRYPPRSSIPTAAPQLLSVNGLAPRQATSASSSSSATPLPATTTSRVAPIRAGSPVSLWMLIQSIVFLILALWLGVYLFWKTRKIQRETASSQGEGGGDVMQPLAPQEAAAAGGPRLQPQTANLGSTNVPNDKGYVRVSYARTQFTCLIILALLFQVPLGLLAYSASAFSAAATAEGGYYGFIGGVVDSRGNWPYSDSPAAGYGSSANSNALSGYCVREDGSPMPTSTSYYSTGSQQVYRNDPRDCPGGQGAYTPDFGSSPSFAKYATPVVLLLVFGWVLFISVVALCVLLYLHRGESRKERRERRNNVVQQNLMMEMWRAGWQAQSEAAAAASAAMAQQQQGRGPIMMYGQQGGAMWGMPRTNAGYGPLPTTPMSQQDQSNGEMHTAAGHLDRPEASARSPSGQRAQEERTVPSLPSSTASATTATQNKGRSRQPVPPPERDEHEHAALSGIGSRRSAGRSDSSNHVDESRWQLASQVAKGKGKQRERDPDVEAADLFSVDHIGASNHGDPGSAEGQRWSNHG